MLSHWIGVEIFIFFIPKEELNTVFLFLSPFYSAHQEKAEGRADVRWVAKSNGSTQKRNWKREEALVSALQLLD